MEISRLRYFRTIVDAGGLRRAAAVLHVSPGALSKAMRELEREFDQKLFARAGRGVTLTPQGRTLYATSSTVIAEYDRMRRSLDPPPASEQTWTIAAVDTLTTYCLGAVMSVLPAATEMHVYDLAPGRIEEAVQQREVDVGITHVPFPHPDLEFRRVASMEFGIYARTGAFEKTPFDDLPFAMCRRAVTSSPTGPLATDGWPYERIPRLIRYCFSHLESGLEAVRRGLCAIFIPCILARLHNRHSRASHQLSARPLPARMPTIRHTVFLVRRSAEIAPRAWAVLAKELAATLERP
jgi:DNA-binding transcriptional LysR family regulator